MRLRARNAGAEMTEHQTIWLQPWCAKCRTEPYGDGREWCEDEAWGQCDCGAMPVKYALAPDQPEKPEPEAEEDE
jgi:hypothetical protein